MNIARTKRIARPAASATPAHMGYMDKRHSIEQLGDVLGWFKIPVWED